MADSVTKQQIAIRKECESLRRLIASVQPSGRLAILEDVGSVERDTLVAGRSELLFVRERLRQLLEALMWEGIITAERWQKFFGEVD